MRNSSVESSLYKELYDFILVEIGFKINENTVFFKDLQLIGDDADIFMIKFSKKFNVDLNDFKFKDYFIEEYNVPLLYYFDKWLRKKKMRRKEFNIEHFEKILMEKRWIDVS